MFTSIRVSSTRASKPDAIIVGVFNDGKVDRDTAAIHAGIKAAAKRSECSGDIGCCCEIRDPGDKGPTIYMVGLGARSAFEPVKLRNAIADAAKRLCSSKSGTAVVELHHALAGIKNADAETLGQMVGEGFGLLGWHFDEFRGTAAKKRSEPIALKLSTADKPFAKGMKRGLALADSTNITRDLSQTPASVASTTFIAKFCKDMARLTPGLSCKVISGKQLETEKLAGIMTVGRAGPQPPCLIRLAYTPPKAARGAKPLVIVGKTIVYDTGGLSLKVGGSMPGMKRDKDGGVAVIGAMHAIATVVKPKRPVVALLACAENSVASDAYRPDDVITFRNGVTVEVTNTDAEGRLVMADALCYACDKEKPGAIVDIATLTGGVVVALGDVFAGCWCDDDELRGQLECSMAATGERWWRMPHDRDYREMMRSPVADILNSAPVRKAHPIQGAAFLSYFVKPGIPWAHLDIAGVHAVDSDKGCIVKGPTGFGVRLLAQLADM